MASNGKLTLIGPFYPYRGGIAHFAENIYDQLKENYQIQVINIKEQIMLILNGQLV